MTTEKIIVRIKYDFFNNTIKYAKRGYIVTDETPTYYYCGEIGETFYKKKEKEVLLTTGNCWTNLTCWMCRTVETDKLELNLLDMNNILKEYIIDSLKARIEEVEII